jgi:CheY-like chemotaxis protein
MQLRTIILADDDADDMAILKEAVEELSSTTILQVTSDGEQLLAMLDRDYTTSNPPALIILDLNMPRLNGTQTLKLLKSSNRYKDIPVVIYSTSVNPLEKEKCMLLGAHSYITKPISFTESRATAERFLKIAGG